MWYVVYFDVNSHEAREAAVAITGQTHVVDRLARRHAPIHASNRGTRVRVVRAAKPVEGELCPRVMATPPSAPDLRDLPEPEPPRTSVPLVTRGLHRLTPIEAPFYDALQATDLVFAVQPRVQGDRTYRSDFIVFHGGRAVVVELDGQEGHRTKEERVYDAKKEVWFQKKGSRCFDGQAPRSRPTLRGAWTNCSG